MSDCLEFHEHPHWRSNPDKTCGVTWDAWCSKCGFRVENSRFDDGEGLGISSGGRRLAKYVTWMWVNGEVYISDKATIYCSACKRPSPANQETGDGERNPN